MLFETIKYGQQLQQNFEAIKNDISGTIKRGYTNVGIRNHDYEKELNTELLKFNNIYYKNNQTNILLKNITLQSPITSRMNDIETDFYHNIFKVCIQFNRIALVCDFQITNDDIQTILPVQIGGKLIIQIDNLKSDGLIGVTSTTGEDRDFYRTNNFDLSYEYGKVHLQIFTAELENNNEPKLIYTEKTYTNLDESIVKALKHDLLIKAEQTIKQQLDIVLNDIALIGLLNGDGELMEKQIEYITTDTKYVNKIVDELVSRLQKYILDQKLNQIEIKNLDKEFLHSIGEFSYWGTFNGCNGIVTNLGTCKRRNHISIDYDPRTNELAFFGLLDFEELSICYNSYHASVWNMGTHGMMKAYSIDNLIKFKLLAHVQKSTHIVIRMKKFELKIHDIGDIKIDATGLGYGLDWLRLNILNWINGLFKFEVIPLIEEIFNSQDVVSNVLQKYTVHIPQ